MKTMMTGYEDGKLLRMKGTIIPRHSNFAGSKYKNFTYKIVACEIWTSQL
jgi:hypothetical protein